MGFDILATKTLFGLEAIVALSVERTHATRYSFLIVSFTGVPGKLRWPAPSEVCCFGLFMCYVRVADYCPLCVGFVKLKRVEISKPRNISKP